MALDPKVALDLIKQKQQLAQEESVNDRTTIKQIKEKLIQIEGLIKNQKQEYSKDENKREQLYRLTEDLKTIIPKQVSFMDNVRMDSARLEEFLEVNFSRMFTGVNAISSSIGTVMSTISGGFSYLRNTFTSISTQTLSVVKGYIQNSWSYARRFLTLDIKQQLNNVVGLITGAIRGIVSAVTSVISSTIRIAFNATIGVLRAGLRAVTTTIVTPIRVMWNSITTILGQVWNVISSLTSMVFRFVYQTLLRVSSFIFSFVWNSIKWIAGAIAGFVWNTLKDISGKVAQTIVYVTTKLVGTIVISIMAAIGPYLLAVTLAFLAIGYLTGQLSNWFSSILSWFGFSSAEDASSVEDAHSGSPSEDGNTFFGWMRKKFFGDGSDERGWMGDVINWMKDLLGITGSGAVAVMGWANRVMINPLIEFLLSTTFGNFLSNQFERFYSWFNESALPAIRTYLFGENEDTIRTQIEKARKRLRELIPGGHVDTTILGEIRRRRTILATNEHVENYDRYREMLMQAEMRLTELQDERRQLRSTIIEGLRKIEEEDFEDGVISQMVSWWVGENGEWGNPTSSSPWGKILEIFFGETSINWSTQTGIIGTIKQFIVEDVFNPLVYWFNMNVIPYLNRILRTLANVLSQINADIFAQEVRESMRWLNRRRMEEMRNMGVLTTFSDTEAIMTSFEQTDEERSLIGRIFQMDISESERMTLNTARRALQTQMPFEDIGITDLVSFIEENPQFMEDSISKFEETVKGLKDIYTRLIFSYKPDYFGFDETYRRAFSERVANYFAQHGVDITPGTYDYFLENLDTILGDDVSIYSNRHFEEFWDNFKIYREVWSEVYGSEVIDVLDNMISGIVRISWNFGSIFNELGNGDRQRGMEIWINQASFRDFGSNLNEAGLGVGHVRRFVQRTICEADRLADEYFGFAEGGVALPFSGGINALIAEAGDPEMVIPLNTQGADFIIDTINKVNVGDTNSDLHSRLQSIEDKLDVVRNTSTQTQNDPANYDMGQYSEPVEYPADTSALDFVKMLSMGIFEGK